MSGMIFKFFGIALALLLALYGIAAVFRKARRLDSRIEEFRREQEQRQGSSNPYADLAELYTERSSRDTDAKKRR